MCNKEHLVGYLYGELTSAEQATFRLHLAGCAECRAELEGLESTRQHLAAWSPPEPEINFTVVQTPSRAAVARRVIPFVPQWALAAAAALIVVAGAAAIANLEIRYGQDGSITLRTGLAGAPAESQAPTAPSGSGSSSPGVTPARLGTPSADALQVELAALRQRLQEIETTLQARSEDRAVRSAGGISAADLRTVLAASEERQRTEMNVLVTQVWRDFSAVRASDLARVQQTLMQAQGLTNTQLRQQRETLDSLRYLHTVSQQK